MALDPQTADSLVTSWFQENLGRAPQQGGLDYWSAQLESGRDPKAVLADLLYAAGPAASPAPSSGMMSPSPSPAPEPAAPAPTSTVVDYFNQNPVTADYAALYGGQVPSITGTEKLSDADIANYVRSVNNNPALIAEAARANGVTIEDIARATGSTPSYWQSQFNNYDVVAPESAFKLDPESGKYSYTGSVGGVANVMQYAPSAFDVNGRTIQPVINPSTGNVETFEIAKAADNNYQVAQFDSSGNYIGTRVVERPDGGGLFGTWSRLVSDLGDFGLKAGAAYLGAQTLGGLLGPAAPVVGPEWAGSYADLAGNAVPGAGGLLGGAATTVIPPVGSEWGGTYVDVAGNPVVSGGAVAGGAVPGITTPPSVTAPPVVTAPPGVNLPGITSPTDWTKYLPNILGTAGGLITGQSAVDAAKISAAAQLEAAKMAADAAKFKPIGVTTRFGGSQFQYDNKGNLIGAGYQLSPDVAAAREKLIGVAGDALTQYQGAQAATAPLSAGAQRMMELGQGYLGTSPQEQAAKFMQEQQALLAASRERERAALETRLRQQGRLGLATGGTTSGMMAANPEMEAFYNAQRQQDLQLAANATQGGMDYAKFGAGMLGLGSSALKDMYATQSAAYDPFKTALGGATTLEGLGQQSMDMGINLGAKGQNPTGANALLQGGTNAAQTMQQANQYSPWGTLLSGIGQGMQNYQFNPLGNQAII